MTSKKDLENSSIEIDETLPDVVKGFLRRGYQLEDIFLDARGRWHHQGEAFENEKIIALFSRSVGRTDGGTWVLEVPPYTYPIRVEDTGFFVEHIDLTATPPKLHLSDETHEALDLSTLSYAPEGRLYCSVKGGRFRARFKKPAYYAIAEHFVERGEEIWAQVGGEAVRLL